MTLNTPKKIVLWAPAKINLFLEVTGKRTDGYHELATLFVKTSLADQLTLCVQESPQEQLQLQIIGPLAAGLKADDTNLVLRAVRAFEAQFGVTLQAHIILEKNIPMGAGLGGGSSDAGTVLRALCLLFNKNPLDLLAQATKLGADVPLFLYQQDLLKGEGIGEKLTPLQTSGALPWAVLVYPDTVVPTKGVFSRLQLPKFQEVLTSCSNLDKLIRYVQEGRSCQEWESLLFNRLESAVLPYICSVQEVKREFSSLGACPLMSGSGSTVFALAPNRERAYDLAGRMKKDGRKVFVVRLGGTKDENNRSSDSFDGGRAPQSIC